MHVEHIYSLLPPRITRKRRRWFGAVAMGVSRSSPVRRLIRRALRLLPRRGCSGGRLQLPLGGLRCTRSGPRRRGCRRTCDRAIRHNRRGLFPVKDVSIAEAANW